MQMAIITRYLTGEVYRFIGILLMALLTVYFAVEFFEKIDDFLENSVPVTTILVFFALEIPFILTQMIPLCLLLAVLVVFGVMTRQNEILALRSSGVSVYYLFSPVFLIGVLTAIAMFVFSEWVVPVTVAHTNRIWNEEIRRISFKTGEGQDIWIKEDDTIVHIAYANPRQKQIQGVSVYRFDGHFRLVHRMDAAEGRFVSGRWLLSGVMEQQRGDGDSYNTRFWNEKPVRLDVFPEDLLGVVKQSDEMSFLELRQYIKKIESEGYNAAAYKVDLFAKVAFPVVCILLVMIATGVAFRWRIRENLPLSIVAGIAIAFFYWVVHGFSLSLGYGEVLPPLLAAWSANLIFFCVGVFLLLYAE